MRGDSGRSDRQQCRTWNWAGELIFFLGTSDSTWTLGIDRTTVPQHGLLVLNRNGMNNFIRHLTPGTELDIQGQIVHVSGGDEKHDGELRLQTADLTKFGHEKS
jgi:hypothetical protein